MRSDRDRLADMLEAMERIQRADRGAHSDLESLQEDFLLVDDATAVRMIYDEQGRFEQPELVEDVRPYRVRRDMPRRWPS